MKCSLLALITIIFLLGSGCETPVVEPITIAEDISVEAPEQAERLVENDQVAVTRITLKPREALPLHKGLDRVVYSLNRYRLRSELQNQAVLPDSLRLIRVFQVHTSRKFPRM